MYCIVSWDISAEGEVWREQNAHMKHCFSAVTSAKPVYTFYIVKLPTANHVTTLHGLFESVRKASPVSINYIVSPPFKSLGGFRGCLSDMKKWTEVNEVVIGDLPANITPAYNPAVNPKLMNQVFPYLRR